jgi:hypothetical protein
VNDIGEFARWPVQWAMAAPPPSSFVVEALKSVALASAVTSVEPVPAVSHQRCLSAAGERYLAIIAPVNEVVAMFNAASDDSFKARAIRALSIVLDLVTGEIETVEWPDDAIGAVRQLVAATDAARAAADLLVSNLTDAASAAFAHEVGVLATASSGMRAVLGLPAAGTSESARR